jgi:hypothetical protein
MVRPLGLHSTELEETGVDRAGPVEQGRWETRQLEVQQGYVASTMTCSNRSHNLHNHQLSFYWYPTAFRNPYKQKTHGTVPLRD